MSAAASQRRIALLPSSADAADTAPLRLVESMLWAFQGTTRSSWVASKSTDKADVAVIAGAARNERVEAWRQSGKPVIFITMPDAPPVNDEHVLVYPFRANQLLHMLNALDARLDAPVAVTSAPVVPQPATATGVHKATLRAWSFVEALRTLREVQNSEVWLSGVQGQTPRLWIKGDGSEYSADPATVQDIRRGAFPFSETNLRKGAPPPAHRGVRSAAELQWFAGSHADARLAPWLSESVRYRITRWPNFGLIRPLPSQIRATALLGSTPLTASDLARRGALPPEEALRTLNALDACGLLEAMPDATAAKPASQSASPPAAPGGFGSFVRLLRKRLGLSEST